MRSCPPRIRADHADSVERLAIRVGDQDGERAWRVVMTMVLHCAHHDIVRDASCVGGLLTGTASGVSDSAGSALRIGKSHNGMQTYRL